MICSVAMCTNLTKTAKNISIKNNDFAVQFYKRFFKTETSKLLFSTSSNAINEKRSGNRNGKIHGRMVGEKAKKNQFEETNYSSPLMHDQKLL